MKSVLKSIYKSLPLKKEFFQILKSIYKPGKGVYQHLYFNSDFNVKVEPEKSFRIRHYGFEVENEIFWNGLFNGWEKYSLRLWKELCEKSDTILDIGANTGVYGLVAKTTNSKAKVYAFEPVKRVYEKLVQNNALNHFDIKCVNKAISNSDGKATIYDTANEHTYSVTVNVNTNPDSTISIPTEIETITLDTFIKEENLRKIDLMKIDVEKHEVEALEGFQEHLIHYQPTMLIEILDDEVANGVHRLLNGIDYLFFNIDEENGIRQVQRLSKSKFYNFLICKPEVAASLITLNTHRLN
jgi:FkbM family methyltransferase